MTLTFQKEVGERMTARLSHVQRSRLSIITQYLCHVRKSITRQHMPHIKNVLQFHVQEKMYLVNHMHELFQVKLKFIIRGQAFVPLPDVDVAVVRFTPRKNPLIPVSKQLHDRNINNSQRVTLKFDHFWHLEYRIRIRVQFHMEASPRFWTLHIKIYILDNMPNPL